MKAFFILVLLNYKVWFCEPFSIPQIISWLLLILSAYIAVAGYITLKRKGLPDNNFENTSVLVRSGLYHFIRHPLYLSVFMLGTGVMIKQMGILQLCLGTVNLVAIYITARIEEKEMIARFGDDYKEYMKETRMFIPFVL
ncbi:MAG: isoprenylcysteine carboxylmethyltransferase family protein [Bacteroidales bacterium]|nr:isoprenylcysteine carboxylmethyltransferase family protein [Bacteroidales bacterium]